MPPASSEAKLPSGKAICPWHRNPTLHALSLAVAYGRPCLRIVRVHDRLAGRPDGNGPLQIAGPRLCYPCYLRTCN